MRVTGCSTPQHGRARRCVTSTSGRPRSSSAPTGTEPLRGEYLVESLHRLDDAALHAARHRLIAGFDRREDCALANSGPAVRVVETNPLEADLVRDRGVLE